MSLVVMRWSAMYDGNSSDRTQLLLGALKEIDYEVISGILGRRTCYTLLGRVLESDLAAPKLIHSAPKLAFLSRKTFHLEL